MDKLNDTEILPYGYVGETICTFSPLPEEVSSKVRSFKVFSVDAPLDNFSGWYRIDGCHESKEEIFLLAESSGRKPLHVCAWG